MSVYVTIDSVEVAGVSHDVDDVTPRLTLGGTDPLAADGRYGAVQVLDGNLTGTVAFDAVSDGVRDLTISLDCLLDGGGEVTIEQTVRLG